MHTFRQNNDRGFAHVFLMLVVVVAIGAIGAWFVFSSKADTVSFTLLGTHPQAAAQPTDLGKILRTLKGYNGKVYAGFGDYGANTGPIAVTPYDPATNAFGAKEFTQSTEMIGFYRSWNNKLYAPSIDPIYSDFGVGDLANGALTWKEQGPSWQPPIAGPYLEHVFDANTLTGTDIWLGGSAGDDAVVFRSSDGGLTWSEMLRVPGNGTTYYRFYGIGVLGDKLYVQASSVTKATNTVGSPETRSHVFSNGTWTLGPSLITSGWAMGHAEAFAGKLVYFTESPADFIPYSCPKIFNGSGVSTNCPAGFSDFSVAGDTLYGMGTDKKVYSTKDLNTWYVQGTAPSTAVSITALNGKIYVGTTDSKLYSAPVATSPSVAGSTTSGSTKTKPGGGGGSTGGCRGKRCTSADPVAPAQ
jgi:hypothetical protein